MLGDGAVNLSLTNQANNRLHLAFGELIVGLCWAGLKRCPGHMWPPGLSLPPSDLASFSLFC